MKRVILDTDPQMNYETRGFISGFFHFFLLLILNNLPASSRNLIKRSHHTAKKVIETATTHDAIEVFYVKEGTEDHRTFLQKFFYRVWFNTDNPRAVRNRLKLVKREVKKSVSGLLEAGETVNILSIASGSSRAIVESLMELRNEEGGVSKKLENGLKVTFLDKNPAANDYSKKLVGDGWLLGKTRWITDTATNFPAHHEGQDRPNIIEMVGLLDYFSDEKILRIFRIIYESLPEGGVLISANIIDNKERRFVTNVVGWEMIYREPQVLLSLAVKVGFKRESVVAYCEPLGIHFVMTAKK